MSDSHPVDIHVGHRFRARRKAIGLPQSELAAALDVTFQQVQKYEQGRNRISASKLFEAACILKVRPDYFFEGLPGAEGPDHSKSVPTDDAPTPHGLTIVDSFARLNSKQRRAVENLIRSLAGEGDSSAA